MTESGKGNASYASGGTSLSGLLTVLFVGLKLTDHIDWSWWWVLAPVWVSFAAWALVFVLALGVLIAKGVRP